MNTGDMFRIVLMIGAVFLFGFTMLQLAKRRLTEALSLAWSLLALILFVTGIIIRPTELSRILSKFSMVLIVILIIIFFAYAFFLSAKISLLAQRSQEMAMQISLLNNENEQMLKRISKLESGKELEDEEKNSVCN